MKAKVTVKIISRWITILKLRYHYDESVTKQLIDSQVAKLKLSQTCTNVSDLVKDIQKLLLPQKSGNAIQN